MKLPFKLLSVLFVCFLPMFLASCGDDDKDEPDSSNPLIGSWRHDYDPPYHDIYTFYEGGIFNIKEWEPEMGEYDDEGMAQYLYDQGTGVLTFVLDEDDIETNKVVFADGNNTMYWTDFYGDVWVLTRVK